MQLISRCHVKIRRLVQSFILGSSFLTVMPVPRLDWSKRNLHYFILALPFVGLWPALFWSIAFELLSLWSVSDVLRSALILLAIMAVTGGIHMDGLMDTCDAIFSRRDRETRIKILSDTHTGAFAVMGCVFIIILRLGIFCEIFRSAGSKSFLLALASIPFWSRFGLALLLNTLPFAKEGGLARTLGSARSPRHTPFLIINALIFAALLTFAAGWRILVIPMTCAVIFFAWRRCCLNIFGGIAGDLLGTFAELSETAMLFALLFL